MAKRTRLAVVIANRPRPVNGSCYPRRRRSCSAGRGAWPGRASRNGEAAMIKGVHATFSSQAFLRDQLAFLVSDVAVVADPFLVGGGGVAIRRATPTGRRRRGPGIRTSSWLPPAGSDSGTIHSRTRAVSVAQHGLWPLS